MDDPSLEWEGIANAFAAIRSDIGREVVMDWAKHVPPGGAILDLGCGTGSPNGLALMRAGFSVYGIDPSPTMVAAFRRNVPGASVAQEPIEVSRFFDRSFDGIIAIGLLFLLSRTQQAMSLHRIAEALRPGGHLLFSAPKRSCDWIDTLTGRQSRSLGREGYIDILSRVGCGLAGTHTDDGGNHYYHFIREAHQSR